MEFSSRIDPRETMSRVVQDWVDQVFADCSLCQDYAQAELHEFVRGLPNERSAHGECAICLCGMGWRNVETDPDVIRTRNTIANSTENPTVSDVERLQSYVLHIGDVVRLGCGHYFHRHCLVDMLHTRGQNRGKCPLCRVSLICVFVITSEGIIMDVKSSHTPL